MAAATICPTITADTPELYKQQMMQIADFAVRIHIDIADGILAPKQLLPVDKIWWPGGIRADLHVMMQKPFEHAAAYKALGPQLVIVHAEGEGDYIQFAADMHRHGIEAGVALLPASPVELITPALSFIDHVLIFSGNLGHFGGEADLALLAKVRQLKRLKPTIEIGWDGGINDRNVRALKDGGVDVLNTGGFVHNTKNPAAAYETLLRI